MSAPYEQRRCGLAADGPADEPDGRQLDPGVIIADYEREVEALEWLATRHRAGPRRALVGQPVGAAGFDDLAGSHHLGERRADGSGADSGLLCDL